MIMVVLLPAILFALIHMAPFKKKVQNKLYILLIKVFMVGLILSIQRAITGSLYPSVLGHSLVNLGGIMIYNIMYRRINMET